MKGFKKDGKFRPTEKKSKSALKKSDVRKKQTVDIKSEIRNKQTTKEKYSEEDYEGGQSLFDNWIGESPQEWVQILGDEYPLSKKTHDNWWNYNSLGYSVFDDPEGEWSGSKEVVVLTDRDRDSLIRYWIDHKKEDELADKMERERDERLEATARKELGDAFGQEIDEIHGSHNAFSDVTIGGWEDNLYLEVVVPFTATPDELKKVEEKSGWKVMSVGNGIKLRKEGFKGKVR